MSRRFRTQLHLVTEPRSSADELLRAVEQAVLGGVDWVQLRDKQASALAMHRLGERLRTIVHDSDARSGDGPAERRGDGPGARRDEGLAGGVARLSINDRLDVALALGADGVHLAGQSLPVDAAVRLAGGRLLVGRSVHSKHEAVEAARDGADYVTFGHVFPSSSKPGLPPRGLAELTHIVEAVDVPVIAIGGITADNLDAVLATGCAGIAVISAILSAPDPRYAAARLRHALDDSPHLPRRPFPAPERQPATT